MDRAQAEAVYDSGREACVEFLLELTAGFEARAGRYEAQVERLEARIARLEERARSSSRTSSKPPSSDPPKTRQQRRAEARAKAKELLEGEGKRGAGGQSGHRGSGRKLLPEDLIEILTYNKLHYNHASESGVLFHLIGALSEFWKLGLTAIANSREEVDELYLRTLNILDTETAYGR